MSQSIPHTISFLLLSGFVSGCIENKFHSLSQENSGVDLETSNLESESSTDEPQESQDYSTEQETSTSVNCSNDAPPQIQDYSPQTGSVLEIGGVIQLEAWALDDNTSGDQLTFRWTHADGSVLDEVSATTTGYASGQWSGHRTEGEQSIFLHVIDQCENTTVVEIPLCQEVGYLQDELELENWNLEGDAYLIGNEVELTGIDTWRIGSAFMTDEIVMANDINIRFEYKTEGGTGADGISLTALNVDEMTTFIGGHGCGIGYGGGVGCTDGPGLPGWSIELDTWYNPEQPDPTTCDHIALSFDGDIAYPKVWKPVHELEETGWHQVEITVDAPKVRVVIDDVLYLDEEVDGDFDFPAYIGFTGSTGGQTNSHRIRGLTVSENICGAPTEEVNYLEPTFECDDSVGEVSHSFTIDSDWGSGYCASVEVQNPNTNTIGWEVVLPADGTINNMWNAVKIDDGNQWRFRGESWNMSILAGQSTSFGFCANR